MEGLIMSFLLMLFGIAIIGVGIAVISIIAMWKLYTKAGEEGWKSIIPIYNRVVLCKIVGITPYWVLVYYIGTMVFSFIGAFFPAAAFLSTAVGIYFTVVLSISLAKSFGKNEEYSIGLILLGIVFYPILAFGKSEYIGPTPMKDPVTDWITSVFDNGQQTSNSKQNQGQQNKICKNCGDKNLIDAKFCSNCGEKFKEE